MLDVFDSTVDIRTFAYVYKVEARACRDIMAEQFDLEAVVGDLTADPRAICDSVMDQEVIRPTSSPMSYILPSLPSPIGAPSTVRGFRVYPPSTSRLEPPDSSPTLFQLRKYLIRLNFEISHNLTYSTAL